MILILFSIIATPMLERKLENEAKARLEKIAVKEFTLDKSEIESKEPAVLTRGRRDD